MPTAPVLGALALAASEAVATVPSVPVHNAFLVTLVAGKWGFLSHAIGAPGKAILPIALLDGAVLSTAFYGERLSLASHIPPDVKVLLIRFGSVYAAFGQCVLVIVALWAHISSPNKAKRTEEGPTADQLAALEPPVTKEYCSRCPTPEYSLPERLDPTDPGNGSVQATSQGDRTPQEEDCTAPTTPGSVEAVRGVDPMPSAVFGELSKEEERQDQAESSGAEVQHDGSAVNDNDSNSGQKQGPVAEVGGGAMLIEEEGSTHNESGDVEAQKVCDAASALPAVPAEPTVDTQPPDAGNGKDTGEAEVVQDIIPATPTKEVRHEVPRSPLKEATTTSPPRGQHARHISYGQAESESKRPLESSEVDNALAKRHTSGNLRKLRLSFGRRRAGESKTHHILSVLRHRTVSGPEHPSEEGNGNVANATNATSAPSSPKAKHGHRSSRMVSLVLGERANHTP